MTQSQKMNDNNEIKEPAYEEFKDDDGIDDAFVVSKAQYGIQFFFRIPSQIRRVGKESDGKSKKASKNDDQSADETNRSMASAVNQSRRTAQPNQSRYSILSQSQTKGVADANNFDSPDQKINP